MKPAHEVLDVGCMFRRVARTMIGSMENREPRLKCKSAVMDFGMRGNGITKTTLEGIQIQFREKKQYVHGEPY